MESWWAMAESSRYRGPDLSDKRDDECWVEYWDRKRRERHGDNCGWSFALIGKAVFMYDGHGWCPHTYENDPEVIQ